MQDVAAITNNAWKARVTFHGIDLNQDLLHRIDSEIALAEQSVLDEQVSKHWIFESPVYRDHLMDLVKSVRQAPALAASEGFLSDKQLAALLLQTFKLWDEPAPVGLWGQSAFLLKFLAAVGRLSFRTNFLRYRHSR